MSAARRTPDGELDAVDPLALDLVGLLPQFVPARRRLAEAGLPDVLLVVHRDLRADVVDRAVLLPLVVGLFGYEGVLVLGQVPGAGEPVERQHPLRLRPLGGVLVAHVHRVQPRTRRRAAALAPMLARVGPAGYPSPWPLSP